MRDLVAVAFEQRADRGGRQPLPSDDTTPPVTKMYFGLAHAVFHRGLRSGKEAIINCRTRSRSSGVSTPAATCGVSTTRMRMPWARARSCSSDSSSSSGAAGARLTSAASRADTRRARHARGRRPDGLGRGAARRDRGAREIQGVAAQVGDDFHDVRTVEFFDARANGRLSVLISTDGVGEQRRDGGVDGRQARSAARRPAR